MDAKTDKSAGKCPFTGGHGGYTNRDGWPNQLDIQVLHHNSNLSDPIGEAFDYAEGGTAWARTASPTAAAAPAPASSVLRH